MIPKIKISNNIEKITNPGAKQVFRLYDRDTNKAIADVISLAHETIDDTKPYTILILSTLGSVKKLQTLWHAHY